MGKIAAALVILGLVATLLLTYKVYTVVQMGVDDFCFLHKVGITREQADTPENLQAIRGAFDALSGVED